MSQVLSPPSGSTTLSGPSPSCPRSCLLRAGPLLSVVPLPRVPGPVSSERVHYSQWSLSLVPQVLSPPSGSTTLSGPSPSCPRSCLLRTGPLLSVVPLPRVPGPVSSERVHYSQWSLSLVSQVLSPPSGSTTLSGPSPSCLRSCLLRVGPLLSVVPLPRVPGPVSSERVHYSQWSLSLVSQVLSPPSGSTTLSGPSPSCPRSCLLRAGPLLSVVPLPRVPGPVSSERVHYSQWSLSLVSQVLSPPSGSTTASGSSSCSLTLRLNCRLAASSTSCSTLTTSSCGPTSLASRGIPTASSSTRYAPHDHPQSLV